MKKKIKNKKKGSVLSVIGILMITAVIILCSMLVLPGIFGYHMYNVISGSMEPAVKVGSLIYVRADEPAKIKENDIIAFYSSAEDGGIITHRVIENNAVAGRFRTKGDANDTEDLTPIEYENYIGRVSLVVPYMGELFTVMSSSYGKIAAACVTLLGALLSVFGSGKKD
ncbi:MAG: signal peptidase I [Dorea sp.]|nr:signal peptidase I [Dorea sp.]